MLSSQREPDRPRYRVINLRSKGFSRKRVIRHALQRFLKRQTRFVMATVATVNRSDRIPAVRAGLPRIELTVGFEFELTHQFVERAIVLTLGREYQA
jgi:hypothetical protein